MERVYARLRRHPWLVDGALAAVLLAGTANAYLLYPAVLPASLALAGTVVVRRRFPAGALAAAHASPGAAAEVTLRYDQDELLVRVADDGHGPAGLPRYGAAAAQDPVGHGLAGMRERAARYGGTVAAAPHPGGGFEVTARLPLGAQRGAA